MMQTIWRELQFLTRKDDKNIYEEQKFPQSTSVTWMCTHYIDTWDIIVSWKSTYDLTQLKQTKEISTTDTFQHDDPNV